VGARPVRVLDVDGVRRVVDARVGAHAAQVGREDVQRNVERAAVQPRLHQRQVDRVLPPGLGLGHGRGPPSRVWVSARFTGRCSSSSMPFDGMAAALHKPPRRIGWALRERWRARDTHYMCVCVCVCVCVRQRGSAQALGSQLDQPRPPPAELKPGQPTRNKQQTTACSQRCPPTRRAASHAAFTAAAGSPGRGAAAP